METKIIIPLLIILFIICFLKFKTKENFIINNEEWINYRLGDIVYLYKDDKFINEEPNYLKNIHKNFPNSIASEYLLKNIKKEKNLDLLFNIVTNRIKKLNLQQENNIVIHLRLGDIMKNIVSNKIQVNKNIKASATNITQIKNLKKLIPLFKNHPRPILIYYGSHKQLDENQKKTNKEYLNRIRNFFKNNNIKFIEKSNGNPDEDFINMCNSKLFIKSGGGYSRLISSMVKKRKNKVIIL